MSNIITDVRRSLIARLETIQAVNGYRTNIGGLVRAGWFSEITSSEAIPATGMVVVQRAKGREPKGGGNALRLLTGFSVIGAASAGLHGYEDAIEDIELDLLRCLTPTEGVFPDWLPAGAPNLIVGSPEPVPPGDGMPAASVLIPIHIITIVNSIEY